MPHFAYTEKKRRLVMRSNFIRINLPALYYKFSDGILFACFNFALGTVCGMILDLKYFNYLINESSQNYLGNSITATTSFKTIIFQLDREFLFIFLTLIASYSLLPKTILAVVTTLKGYQTLTAIKYLFSSNISASIVTRIILSAFMLALSFVFIKYISDIINSLFKSQNVKISELSLLYSKQSQLRVYSTLTTCGSMIIINLIKILLLKFTTLF